ncbi:MAG: hypothetical protein ACU0BF_05180 [Paracoccaceae bacterium]
MTNRIAVWILIALAAALAWDWYADDWARTIFLGREFLELLRMLAVWR